MKKFLISLIGLLLMNCNIVFADVIIYPTPLEYIFYAVFYFVGALIIIGVTTGLIYLIIRLINRVLSKKKNINEVDIFFKGKRKKSKDTDFNNNDDNKNE